MGVLTNAELSARFVCPESKLKNPNVEKTTIDKALFKFMVFEF